MLHCTRYIELNGPFVTTSTTGRQCKHLKFVAQQYERKNPGMTIDTVKKLRALNKRIAAAVELMRECEGSWA